MKTLLSFIFLALLLFPTQAEAVKVIQGPQSTKILGVARRAIVLEALKHVGKPYRWGANGPSAYDCSGFVKAVYAEFGISLPRRSIEQGLSGLSVPVDLRYLRMGDIIYFNMRGMRYPHHIGIYMGRGLFVHASSSRGVDIDILDGRWRDGATRAARLVITAR